MNKLSQYNKFLVAIAGLVVTFLTQRYGNSELVTNVVMILTGLGVYQAKNETELPSNVPITTPPQVVAPEVIVQSTVDPDPVLEPTPEVPAN